MDPDKFEIADRHLNDIACDLEEILQSPQLSKLQESLVAMSKQLGQRYSVSLVCQVEVFDSERERCLPLLNTGVCISDGNQPYLASGDSTPHRYIVNGQIQVVPHDRCPSCWGLWDFKLQHPRCEHCDAELGQNCRLLLDSDVCPNCEEGEVTATRPECSQCGFRVDQSKVTWG